MVRLFWCSRPENFQTFGTSWKVVQNFQPEFPKRKCVYHLRFSPVPSPTPILMRITCHLVGVVQMVHANPDRSFSLGIFAYRNNIILYKLSTKQFSHVNGKQPMPCLSCLRSPPLPPTNLTQAFPEHGSRAGTHKTVSMELVFVVISSVNYHMKIWYRNWWILMITMLNLRLIIFISSCFEMRDKLICPLLKYWINVMIHVRMCWNCALITKLP